PPSSTPSPYTTLFRSLLAGHRHAEELLGGVEVVLAGVDLAEQLQDGAGQEVLPAAHVQPPVEGFQRLLRLADVIEIKPLFKGDLDRKSTRLNSSHVSI